MRVNWDKLFSLYVSCKKNLNGTRDKIEFTGCDMEEKNCLNYLPEINDYFRKSDKFYKNRDYAGSIEALEKAYNKAQEIKQPACFNCALFFQATVVHSVECIHNDLEKMSKGIFATRQHQVYYVKADNLLNKIKPYKEAKLAYSRDWTSSALQSVYH